MDIIGEARERDILDINVREWVVEVVRERDRIGTLGRE